MAEDNNNLPPKNNSGTSPSAMFLEMMRQAAARRAEAEDNYGIEPEPETSFHDLSFQVTPSPSIEADADKNDVIENAPITESFSVKAEPDDDIEALSTEPVLEPEKIKPFIEDSVSEIVEDTIEAPEFEEDIEEEPTYLRGRVPIYTVPDVAKADEIAAKMEEQRIRRIKRRQQRQQKRRVGILGGFIRTALITVISAVLASTVFTWFTDPEFFTSNVVTGLQVANATSVAVIDPLTPTVLAVTPNWARRIGIVSGHRGPENDPGAVCDDGLTEREINFAVAQLVVLGLRENGYSVDLLDEFDPRLDAYQAAALVSIHANDCQDYGEFVSGYLVARAAVRPAGGFDDILAECIARDYGEAVGIERRFSLTVDMTDYHTFREINSLTPAAILELGFMRGDRDLLVNQQDVMASGIIEGILCFLNGETPFEDEQNESPTPETNVDITPLPLNEPTAAGE
ncbi:MAG: hypothetical protein Phog2KO_35100 [Phototrophicaceae bacterium]